MVDNGRAVGNMLREIGVMAGLALNIVIAAVEGRIAVDGTDQT